MGRLKALWLLGWALVATLLRKWFWKRPGLAAFRAHYAADHVLPLSREDQADLVAFSRCIACGLCDVGEGARMQASEGEYPGLMTLALSSLRNTTDVRAAATAWAHVPMSVLQGKEAICPTRVPFRRMKRFVEKKASELDELEKAAD